jgi:lipoprotein-releasing system permease protein
VYKLLLCWRYLRTRYLAMACIISVMLGVATLIVVNSVMGGFSKKLRERLHGLLSDVVVESLHFDGFSDPAEKMQRIRQDPFLSDKVEAVTATLEVFAMLQYRWNGEMMTRPVHVIGIDPESRARVGGFADYLVNPANRQHPSFDLTPEARERWERWHRLPPGWVQQSYIPPPLPGEKPAPDPPPVTEHVTHGAIVGYAIAAFRNKKVHAEDEVKDTILLHPGDEVILTTVSGQRLTPVYDRFVVTDYFKSEMSEYDSNYVFVPLDYLQHLRTMDNRVTALQIKLKHYGSAKEVKPILERLEVLFPGSMYHVATWEMKQGPLLAAIAVEKGILNVLLFLIIAVAGFGILAIFTMIVVEKTRDIGILKALGASNTGVMNIFLGYGLLLGLVGAGLGTVLGIAFTRNINGIEKVLSHITGSDIFPRDVYYFDHIPTHIQSFNVLLVNLGAVAIAVLFSVLPALRAAWLHPVRALRYE